MKWIPFLFLSIWYNLLSPGGEGWCLVLKIDLSSHEITHNYIFLKETVYCLPTQFLKCGEEVGSMQWGEESWSSAPLGSRFWAKCNLWETALSPFSRHLIVGLKYKKGIKVHFTSFPIYCSERLSMKIAVSAQVTLLHGSYL